ncbi:MAG: D-glycero-alpha-D-manno-heptose 7-phosphate kinase [Owenweeksia sp. TMED14]|nr:MAG: D-glycero-alpha-D-manno-heptose 7-phosphate kinase [Owenweeksia sp. TMED14]
MIITRTPFRISFVGGGSDLPSFYQEHGGAVISSTINKYMYISSHDFFEKNRIRTKYSVTETVNSVAEIKHPILRTIMQRINVNVGLEVSSIADVPAGTGMGSSSSFTVGTLHNMMAREGRLKEVNKSWLGEQACAVEIDDLKEPIGKQDQYAAAFGGLNIIRFKKDGSVIVDPINIGDDNLKEFSKYLRLYYIGNQRSASNILAIQNKELLKADKIAAMKTMVSLVDEFAGFIKKSNWEDCGRVIDENWALKQSLANGISNSIIQDIYLKGRRNGAWGAKLLGAGGGGFMLFFGPPSSHSTIDNALNMNPFPFELESLGSQVIFNK